MKSRMRKHLRFIYVFTYLICFSGFVYAEEIPLYDLWTMFITNDFGAQRADYSLQRAAVQNDRSTSISAPSLSVSGSDIGKDVTSLSLSSGVSLPGGASLNGSISTMADMDEDLRDSMNLSIGLSQGLYPYWIQGIRKDPALQNYELNEKSQEYRRSISYRDLILQFTNQVIQFRYYSRQIVYLEKVLELEQMELESFRELNLKGQVSATELWAKERTYWDDELRLLSYKEGFLEAQSRIKRSTGIQFKNGDEISLPDETMYELFKSEYIGDTPLELGELITRRQELENRIVLRKQNNAPSISINFNCTPDFRDTESWSLQMTMDFSRVLSPDRRTNKTLELLDGALLDTENEDLLRERENRKKLLQANIERLSTQVERIEGYYENAGKLYENAGRLYENGEISLLEYRNAEMNVLQKETLLKEIEDQLWYQSFNLAWY